MSIASPMRYWVCTVSKEHVLVGVSGGFCQACHGKKAPLTRMSAGDGIIYYSPKVRMGDDEKCQKFTAIGHIADAAIYSYRMADDFVPFRRNVTYIKDAHDADIHPLLSQLSFTKDRQSNWGSAFRFGVLEIKKEDFDLIHQSMTSIRTKRKETGQ